MAVLADIEMGIPEITNIQAFSFTSGLGVGGASGSDQLLVVDFADSFAQAGGIVLRMG